MPFRRPVFDPNQAVVRPALLADTTAISRMLGNARHYLAHFSAEYLPDLLGRAPASVLVGADQTVWGAAVAGIPAGNTTWLRTIVLADGLPVDLGLAVLMPHLHAQVRESGVRHLYYAGDQTTETWLAPRLRTVEYSHDTNVITYAKSIMDVPAHGNRAIVVRAAEATDIPAILAVDVSCFEAQWVKTEQLLHTSFSDADYFTVAEIDGQVIGYALVVGYFGGKRLHLVRIGVIPGFQHHGIGVRLLSEVVRHAQLRQALQLTLNTQEYNVQARSLYEWFGFQLTGERQLVLRLDLD
jgi:[ribosomal protein S18]-alanine N-acetyltransferase